MDSLERLNELLEMCGGTSLMDAATVRAEEALSPPPPPSLEAIEGWVKRHRDRHALSSETYARLDAALENIEEVRRSRG